MYRESDPSSPPVERVETFSVDREGNLVRSVVPRRGKPYEHRCTRWAFERVCWRFDEHGEGDTVETLCRAAQIPMTQAATALAFLLERGIVTRERKRNYPASIDVHLDAMTEYHALREPEKEMLKTVQPCPPSPSTPAPSPATSPAVAVKAKP